MSQKSVMLVSSSGGHWVQLNRLLPAVKHCKLFFLTTEASYRASIPKGQFIRIPDASRWNKVKVAWLAIVMLWYITRFRPDVIITTGAAPGFFALFWGKKLGAKTLWLDSIANTEELSMSGKMARKYADAWLTQWEHLAAPEGPLFKGSVL